MAEDNVYFLKFLDVEPPDHTAVLELMPREDAETKSGLAARVKELNGAWMDLGVVVNKTDSYNGQIDELSDSAIRAKAVELYHEAYAIVDRLGMGWTPDQTKPDWVRRDESYNPVLEGVLDRVYGMIAAIHQAESANHQVLDAITGEEFRYKPEPGFYTPSGTIHKQVPAGLTPVRDNSLNPQHI
ncbi:MAG: hypothetical protein QF824_01065 [Candidatus Woesearchaeota archaeon]|jgi:hypothetical protein|nr:hypothetical protein [Candidatus Woesearchaeota archaeon]MDP7458055.1 hypothetical protein [Candidatus Woesearchaeota archaeon]